MRLCHFSLLFVIVCSLFSFGLSCVPCRRQDDSDFLRQSEVSSPIPDRPQQNEKDPKTGPDKGPKRPRKRCCPYDFDSRKCKFVDDRLLCGYNRNVGSPQSRDSMVELKDGCRLRNGRLECGYVHPPFTNPRRPPPRPGDGDGATAPGSGDDDGDDGGESPYKDEDPSKLNEKGGTSKTKSKKKKMTEGEKKKEITKEEKKAMANCVEVGGRIVCKEK